ncbi:MAG: Smr/MutS family protein [Deltaproteobacteria bacterium]|nr:Smr/MutS family protein [Deltaproteobacteria bacterium]
MRPTPVEFVPGGFEVRVLGEQVQGLGPGVDPKLLRRLKAGEFARAARVDLHGRTRDEAARLVEQFLRQARSEGARCVSIVHGRGLNSSQRGPVLKETVMDALAHGPASPWVLAWCSARPEDGGTGALYVLLRKVRPDGT